jgi:hypothetical protein
MNLLAAAIAAATVSPAGGGPIVRPFEVALHAGFGYGVGEVLPIRLSGGSLGPKLDRLVPLGIEAGYHVLPRLIMGMYFEYVIGRVDPGALHSVICSQASCSGSGHIIRLGGALRYRFVTDGLLIPWAGLGGGYSSVSEQVVTDLTLPGFVLPPITTTGTTSGLDLLIQAGADVPLRSSFALGLYVSFFTGVSAAVEGGLRARFDL